MSKFCNLVKAVLTETMHSDTSDKIKQFIDTFDAKKQNEKIIEDVCKETLIPELSSELNCENLEKITPTVFLEDKKLVLSFTFKYLHPISSDEDLNTFKKEKIEETKDVINQAVDYIQNVKKMSVTHVSEISGIVQGGNMYNTMNKMWDIFHPQQQGQFQDTESDECYTFGGISIILSDDDIKQYIEQSTNK